MIHVESLNVRAEGASRLVGLLGFTMMPFFVQFEMIGDQYRYNISVTTDVSICIMPQ